MGQRHWFATCAMLSVAGGIVCARGAEDDAAGAAARRLQATHGVVIDSKDSGEAQRRIEAALRAPLKTPLEFVETPLNSIANVISEEYGIPIQFNASALEAEAQSPDTEISIHISNVSLRSALDLMFQNISDLTYLVDHEVLLITTTDDAQMRLEVRVYRVDDLISPELGDALLATDEDYRGLIDIVVSNIDRESWAKNGRGSGEIKPFSPGMLVVCQTRRVHENLGELLTTLRSIKADVQLDAMNDAGGDNLVTRGIPINPDVAKSNAAQNTIRETLMRSVHWADQSGDLGDQVSIAVLPTHVLVRHKPAVVRKVVQTVQSLAMGVARPESSVNGNMRANGQADGNNGGRRGGF